MTRELSAGGVVVRRMRGRWWLAAIQPAGREAGQASPPSRARRRVLALPKGLVEGGESPQQTAAREVREETGVAADLIARLGDVKYVYVRSWGDRQRVFKIVTFYLFRYRRGRLGAVTPAMRREVTAAHWLPLHDAPRLLTYPGERAMAKLALQQVQAAAT